MRGLIFDFDGLILDTEWPDYLSWQQIYRSYGLELPTDLWLSIIGGTAESSFEPHDHLETLLRRRVDREQIWINRRKSYLTTLEGQEVLPGVTELLTEARQAGLRVGVASSSPENWVTGHLNRLGLLGEFDVIVTADDVERTKPDPALFLLAAERMQVKPDEVIVLEDSSNGVHGARRAGMFVVAVPNRITQESDLSHADLVLPSLADTTLEGLIRAAEGRDA
jgi:HAD superfamily hydrolase (TIGR01509 family)